MQTAMMKPYQIQSKSTEVNGEMRRLIKAVRVAHLPLSTAMICHTFFCSAARSLVLGTWTSGSVNRYVNKTEVGVSRAVFISADESRTLIMPRYNDEINSQPL